MEEIDITDELTPKGIEELDVGHLLVFNWYGPRQELKIVRKAGGRVFAQLTHTLAPNEKPQITYREIWGDRPRPGAQLLDWHRDIRL